MCFQAALPAEQRVSFRKEHRVDQGIGNSRIREDKPLCRNKFDIGLTAKMESSAEVTNKYHHRPTRDSPNSYCPCQLNNRMVYVPACLYSES